MNFKDLLIENNVPLAPVGHHHTRHGWTNFDCPFCQTLGRYHMGYNEFGSYVSCWVCGRHDLGETLAKLLRIPNKTARQVAASIPRRYAIRPERYTGTYCPPSDVGPLGPAHAAYLRERGFEPDSLTKLWRLGAIGLARHLKWRIFIPIEYGGTPLSWTTRSIAPHADRRYKAAKAAEEAVDAKTLLYGQDYCRHAAVIHEGPTDVWATGPGAVGTLGTAYSRAQVRKMARYPVRAVAFDNAPDALRRARQLVALLTPLPGETLLIQLDAKDPATASRKEISLLRKCVFGE